MKNQIHAKHYSIFNGDCIEGMKAMPSHSIDMSIYSPPFATDRGGCLYTYSSSPHDMSNSLDKDEFFTHYKFCVQEIQRITKPGRMSCVHCMDVPSGNTGCDRIYDYPGDIIRLHESLGFVLAMRFFVWKEPLTVRNRTMTKSLSHRGITEDSTRCSNAVADQLLIFRNRGENEVAVAHPNGLKSYAGERKMPADVLEYKNWKGSQLQNRYSHWIWRNYASAFWDDVRIDRVLPYRECKTEEDERHVHPLQLDVIERACVMWSNPGEIVLTPFMGVGSECYGAVINNRKAIGFELKTAYFNQAVKNLEEAATHAEQELINI
jgi:DNA modification methylase